MYTAWLMFGDSFKDVYFPDKTSWTRKVVLLEDETGLDRDVYVSLSSLDGRVRIAPNEPLQWSGGGTKEHDVSGDSVFTVIEPKSGWELKVMVKQCEKSWLQFTKYRLPRRKLVIGRNEGADIRDASKLMTGEHGFLGLTKDGYAKYQDQSSNGTYLNGRKLHGTTARLKFGDVLAFPTGLKVVYLGDCLAVNRTGGSQGIALEKWHAPEGGPRARTGHVRSVYQEYQRPPRMLVPCTAEDTEIEAPIAKQNPTKQPLLLQVGPSMTMIFPMLMGTIVASSGNGLLSSGIVMIGTSSALAVMWGIVNRRYRAKEAAKTEEHRIEMYHRYIAEMEQTLRAMNDRERLRLSETFPNAAKCAALPAEQSTQLWDRMPTHPDFLHVRLGTGDVDLPCEISVPKQKLSLIDDELRDEPDRLLQTYAVVKNAPVTLPLRGEAVLGILGDTRAVQFAQGLLMQIAALHSYHDVRIAVLTDEGSASRWSWARWLPHVFASEDRQMRMVANTPDGVHDVVAHLEEVLAIRKSNAADSSGQESGEAEGQSLPLPHYVIFCTDYRILENELIMRQLLTNRQGMTLVMIGEDMTDLPKECRVVLNLSGGVGLMHTSEGLTRNIDFEYPNQGLLQNFSRSMASLRLKDMAENAAIPTLVSFLDIYGVRRIEELDVWRMWTENRTYDGIRSTIGYRAGSKPFVLDISERFHGPHGLIAGTTGSGKSVMLETYILSLALNYSPRQVQFILIDYKGGGMAQSFEGLPHVAGIIDNLQGPRVIDRALASLQGEIHRREHIFKAAQVQKIDEYTRLYGGAEGQEMPHLIIVVDEFAELKSEQPEFMQELVSASRVGRSLGIHLILATQKPSNSVSDEIWANSRFHLCLRVQTPQDSRDMLKRPDAAYLKGMGRCFIQIGNDEEFYQVQTSYSGLDYKPDEPRAEEMPHMLTSTGQVVAVPKKAEGKSGKAISQMKAVLGRINTVAAEHGMASNRQMWLPELPAHVYLRDVELFRGAMWDGENYPNPAGNIVIPMGMADDVANQRYIPYSVDLTEYRNLIVTGLAGTGKTTLVQSMVYSLCSLYDPEHMHIYILSLTSQTLRNLSVFPQVGDIAFDGEELEIKRLINMLFAEMARRADLFAQAATDSFVEYNKTCVKRGQKTVPAIVIFVDRYIQLRDMFANDEFYTSRIQTLLQEGSGRGIHFVVTALAKNEVPARMQSSFGGLALRMKDRSDYTDALGKTVPHDMPPISGLTGRGLGILDGTIYELQFGLGGAAPEHTGEGFAALTDYGSYVVTRALPADRDHALTDGDRADQIMAYGKRLSDAWRGARPEGIPRLPQDPTWEVLLAEKAYAQTKDEMFTIPIGYNMVSGSVAAIRTEKAPSWAVYGTRKGGVTNFLKLMARVMTDRGADVHIIADSNWSRLAGELNASLYTTPEAVAGFFRMFIDTYAKPRKPLHDAALEKGKAAAVKQAAAFKPLCILVDNAERLYADFNLPANKPNQPIVMSLFGEIIEKPFYNFTIFMGFASSDRTALMNDPIKRLLTQGRAIALGGKLTELDPCGVGATLNSKARSTALPLGQGFAGNNGESFQIVVPLAEQEEE